jgi:hypothetical protein
LTLFFSTGLFRDRPFCEWTTAASEPPEAVASTLETAATRPPNPTSTKSPRARFSPRLPILTFRPIPHRSCRAATPATRDPRPACIVVTLSARRISSSRRSLPVRAVQIFRAISRRYIFSSLSTLRRTQLAGASRFGHPRPGARRRTTRPSALTSLIRSVTSVLPHCRVRSSQTTAASRLPIAPAALPPCITWDHHHTTHTQPLDCHLSSTRADCPRRLGCSSVPCSHSSGNWPLEQLARVDDLRCHHSHFTHS